MTHGPIDMTRYFLSQLHGRALGVAALATALLAIAIVVGSRNLADFDAALIGYCFATLPADFSGLGLAVGVMVAQALLRLGVQDIGLKWPNDLLWQGRKLGGVLIELRGEAGGPCDVVVGVGVNVQLPDLPAGLIDQPWTDLGRILGTNRPHRNRVAEALIGALIPGLDRFAEEGLAPFLPHFRERDVLAGRRIRVEQRGDWLEGTARGVSERGALLLEDAAGIRPYWSGEICVRALDP